MSDPDLDPELVRAAYRLAALWLDELEVDEWAHYALQRDLSEEDSVQLQAIVNALGHVLATRGGGRGPAYERLTDDAFVHKCGLLKHRAFFYAAAAHLDSHGGTS